MNEEMKQSDDNRFIPMTSVESHNGHEAAPSVFYYTNQIVNVVMIGNAFEGDWWLVDAGMPKCGKEIYEVAQRRFGKDRPPRAILLTHGHFDHVGGIVYLLEHWDVPVYAHPAEFPFLTGTQAYPEPDPSVEGGLLAKISSIYPHEPINISPALRELPLDGTIPDLAEWRWIPTPGHAPGQVAFFREADGVLLSGDAFITVRQDSLYKVLLQQKEINGPPRYLTTDWQAAWDSVRHLEALNPQIVIPGHGKAMAGRELQEGLRELAADFDKIAIPSNGRFVKEDKEYH